ncbi:hypothetical protein EMMF5_002465 [Cystobasidiomycetes sp. EMM_F5]
MSSTVQSHEASSQDGSPTSPFAAELQLALSIAAEAGQMISSASSSRWRSAANADNATGSELGTKKNSVDLVTETDQAVEKLVKERISAAFPGHKFIGEESYAAGDRPELTDEPTWIVGRYNHLTEHPIQDLMDLYSVSIHVSTISTMPFLGKAHL